MTTEQLKCALPVVVPLRLDQLTRHVSLLYGDGDYEYGDKVRMVLAVTVTPCAQFTDTEYVPEKMPNQG